MYGATLARDDKTLEKVITWRQMTYLTPNVISREMPIVFILSDYPWALFWVGSLGIKAPCLSEKVPGIRGEVSLLGDIPSERVHSRAQS